MKDRNKLAALRANLAAVEELDNMASNEPAAVARGAVFIDMAKLKWIKVAHVRPAGGYVDLAVGPGLGCDVSMHPADVKEAYVDRIGEDLLYFPPGAAAKEAVARINRLRRSVV
jgi:hypothetical protein